MMFHMKAKILLQIAAVALVCLSCASCSLFSSEKGKDSSRETSYTPLTPIRKKRDSRYVVARDLNQVEVRVALVNVISSSRSAEATFIVGSYFPYEGTFRGKGAPIPCASIQGVIDELDPYIDRMPIGLIMTDNGHIPGLDGLDPSKEFVAYVAELQRELTKAEFLYAFIVPHDFVVVK